MALHSLPLQSGPVVNYNDFYSEKSSTILLIHGSASGAVVWDAVIDHLSSDKRIIALNLPGYGCSTIKSQKATIPQQIDFIEEFIQQLGIQDITIVGHSMGGQIAIGLALRLAPIIEKMVLLAPAGLEEFTTIEKQIILSGMGFLRNVQTPENFIQNLNTSWLVHPNEAWNLYNAALLQWAKSKNTSDLIALVSNSTTAMLDHPTQSYLKAITCPVKIVFGERDEFIPNRLIHPFSSPQKLMQNAANEIPKCTTHLINNCGHFPQLDHPEEVMRQILDKRN